MTKLLGQSPWMSIFERAASLLPSRGKNLPLSDGALTDPGSVWEGGDPLVLSILRSRSALRDFTRSRGWPTPQGTCEASLESLCTWAIRRNIFPLAMMADNNGSDGESVFRLEAFREMSTFWDRLQRSKISLVRIEEWVTAPAIIEISMAPTGSLFCSQVGLERHLRARTDWRLFPANLPRRIPLRLAPFIDQFRPRIPRHALLRLTLALTEPMPTLLAISGSVNRIEYFSPWSGMPENECFLNSRTLGNDRLCNIQPSTKLCRLQVLRRSPKKPPFPEMLPRRGGASDTDALYTSAGHCALLLTKGKDPQTASEQAKQILAQLKENEEGSGG